MTDSLKTRLLGGEKLLVFSVGRMFHPNVVHYLGMTGEFPGFWIDLEHSGLTAADVEHATAAGRAHGMEAFVRLAPTDYASVTRVLESGAAGVLAAQIHSAQQTEEFVQWAKFAPRGRRGLNPMGYDGGFGTVALDQFTADANRNSMVGIQIESLGALAEVEEIAAVDGVDFLFVGPSDLSQALGVTGDFMHPSCLDAVDRIAGACNMAGKRWGAVTPNPSYAQLLVDKGCTLLSLTNDVKLVSSGLAATKSSFASIW
jgi:4-hydroxy-2-oxoheptanedioate aldolase